MSDISTKAGVNLKAGDLFSSRAGQICQSSYGSNPYVEIFDWSAGNFRGPRGFEFVNLPKRTVKTIASDGIGTKVILSTAANKQYFSAYDVIAMTGGDITRYGGMPLVFSNVLDVKTLGKVDSVLFSTFLQVLDGLAKVAREQNIVLFNGETAELSDCVSSEITDNTLTQYNWAGFMVGVMHKDKLINSSTLAPGQKIIALQDGLRSNGASLVRKMLREKYGPLWWKSESKDAKRDIHHASTPSKIYDRFFAHANGWTNPEFKKVLDIHSIAHISGGGIRSKFAEDIIFRHGFSANLNALFEPSHVMKSVAEHFKAPDEELYETLNGGQGALFVVSENDTVAAIALADEFGLEARVAGTILEHTSKPQVQVISQFTGDTFTYEPS